MLNVSLIAKVLGRDELHSEMNILPVLIATGRVHYSPQVGYHNTYYNIAVQHISHYITETPPNVQKARKSHTELSLVSLKDPVLEQSCVSTKTANQKI